VGHKFAEIAFTESVREVQQAQGSRNNYAAMDLGDDYNNRLGELEAGFIAERDSFYMSSVSETGWPYLQHRGGPMGFMRVLDDQTLGFADFSGNRQYVSTGNFLKNDRVSLFFMDYPNKRRLKLLGRVRLVGLEETEILSRLEDPGYGARVERGFIIRIEAFDWNCPQHITPRFTQSHVDQLIAPLKEENRLLKSSPQVIAMQSQSALGEGPLELVVTGIRQLTPRIRAYELRHPEGKELPPFEAGAHLQIPTPVDIDRAGMDETGQGKSGQDNANMRHYSICSNPEYRDRYEIAVLREDNGTGGSSAIHDHFHIGLGLRCELPQNYFPLHTDKKPAVLIAGGIGITPIKAMAHMLSLRGVDYHLHFAGRSQPEMAFRNQLEQELGHGLTTYNAKDGERMDVEQILATAGDETVFYVCGPGRLIDAVSGAAQLLKIDTSRIRFERFTVTLDQNEKPIELELRRSGKQILVNEKQTILDAMLEAGIDAPFSCRAGNCKTCAVRVLDGKPDHRDSVLSQPEREQEQLMCPCISRATTAHLTLDL
jgi:hypothetical protein